MRTYGHGVRIMNRRVVLWIVIGCTVLCLGIGLFVLFLGSTLVRWATQTPENIDVDVTVPTTVSMDKESLLILEITNLADEEQVLDSIDIDLSYLDGFVVGNTEPAYVDFSDFSDEYHSFEFHSRIPADHTLEVVFYLNAIQTGDMSGEISVCINSFVNCTNRFIRTIVEELAYSPVNVSGDLFGALRRLYDIDNLIVIYPENAGISS